MRVRESKLVRMTTKVDRNILSLGFWRDTGFPKTLSFMSCFCKASSNKQNGRKGMLHCAVSGSYNLEQSIKGSWSLCVEGSLSPAHQKAAVHVSRPVTTALAPARDMNVDGVGLRQQKAAAHARASLTPKQ